MTKKYSIKRRVLRTVSEIIFGTIIITFFLLILSYLLIATGNLSTYDSHLNISINASSTKKSILEQIEDTTFDYVLFDAKTGEVVSSRYQEADAKYYNEIFKNKKSETIGSVNYKEYDNAKLVLVVREPTLPEFVNSNLRQLSFNTFSYIVFFGLELCLIIWAISRILKEFTRNFRLIQKISLNMGNPELKIERKQTELIEFNDILSMLYQKDTELLNLLESERQEKKDLSFQVGALAHDVKTPLTVLKGNLELLELTDLDEHQLEFIQSINNSVATFEKYFNSMISYSRLLIEDKDYQEKIELSDFLDELSDEAMSIMSAEKIEFKLDNFAKVDYFKGNRLNLSRALINILSNAARYSIDKKLVTLSIIEESDYLKFEVWNNGPSFTKEALENAEKLFYTDNKGRSSKHYGIGLSFAQVVASRHQGKLLLSNPTKGGAQVTLMIKI